MNGEFFPAARRPSIIARFFGALWLITLGSTAAAQWSSVAVTNSADGTVHPGAVAKNDAGASLRIYLAGDDQLTAEFKLGEGLLSLDPVTCPTLQIDQNLPENLNQAQHHCVISGALARFSLTQVQDGQLDSPTFLNLMNGSRLTVRYRLVGAGYGRQSFSLKGSKQVLKAALKHGTTVVGD